MVGASLQKREHSSHCKTMGPVGFTISRSDMTQVCLGDSLLTKVCDGFTYSFTLWTNDGSYREFRYGSTRTFSVDNDEGGAAYYPFLDTT